MDQNAVEKKVYQLEINEVLEHAMPPLQKMELNLLTQSLLNEGCRDPLVVWNGTIVDGHNRYRICQENQIPFSYIEKEFQDEAEAKKWIIRNQLARRNVPDFVRCELVLPLEGDLKAEAKKRQGQRNDLNNIPPNLAGSSETGDTRDSLAEIAGVSHGNLAKAKKLIIEADEDTKDRLRNGEMSIHRAYTELTDREKAQGESRRLPLQELNPRQGDTIPVESKPGDIVPGFGVEQFMGPRDEESFVKQPESVYEIPPIEVYGNMPAEDMESRRVAEMAHAASDLRSSMEYHVRRVGEILRGMSAASIDNENIQILKNIVTAGYNQIMDMMNKKMNGGNENE